MSLSVLARACHISLKEMIETKKMAYLRLESDNPNFSFLVRKNPASGMLVKRLRQGTVFGFYSKNNLSQYNCWFKDHDSSISYNPGEMFEYNDTTRYSAAVFINHCCDEFFRDLLLKDLPEDTVGFNNSLLINCIRAKARYLEIFSHWFRDFQWEVSLAGVPAVSLDGVPAVSLAGVPAVTPVTQGYYRIKLSTNGTLRRLLCFASVFSLINAIKNGECEHYDEGLLVKYAKLIQYLDAPYFVRYVFKVNLVRGESTFGKLKQYLNTDTIQLQHGHNFLHRMRFIEQHLDGTSIIDVGSGEGKYLRFAKKVDHYYAIERVESLRATIERKCQRDQRENVTILESIDELPVVEGRKTILLTEVIEHNSCDEAMALLKRCLLPDSRVIITTPNRDFNVYYFDDEAAETTLEYESAGEVAADLRAASASEFGESEYEDIDMRLRHEDHRFELTDLEFREFITTATAGVNCNVKFFAVGDKVDGISPQSAAVIDVG